VFPWSFINIGFPLVAIEHLWKKILTYDLTLQLPQVSSQGEAPYSNGLDN
jgi:hypothetical protein